MTLGEFVIERRKSFNITRNMLATKSGISHTEINRIETGERKQPSLKVISALAKALEVQPEKLMEYAGYTLSEDTPTINRVFPGLKTEKQKETLEKIADGIARNSELNSEQLDALWDHVEMFLDHANKKKNS